MSAPADFDRLAGPYRWMEFASFGPVLWWCRCAFLGELGDRRRVLVLGDGDGRFTARLLRENPAVEVDAVDASPAMLRALVRRAGRNADRVRTHAADARNWRPAEGWDSTPAGAMGAPFDLIVTHFFLDCFTTGEVEMLARRMRRLGTGSLVWVVSEFAVPPGWYGRLIARPLIRALYAVFNWLTGLTVLDLPDYAYALRKAGFTRRKQRRWLWGLLVSEVWCSEPVWDAGSELDGCR